MTIHPSATIHPTALVDDGATIGANSRVWHWVHISQGLLLVKDVRLGRTFL